MMKTTRLLPLLMTHSSLPPSSCPSPSSPSPSSLSSSSLNTGAGTAHGTMIIGNKTTKTNAKKKKKKNDDGEPFNAPSPSSSSAAAAATALDRRRGQTAVKRTIRPLRSSPSSRRSLTCSTLFLVVPPLLLSLLIATDVIAGIFFLPVWRQACIALLCTALLLAVWLPHIIRSAIEELKRRRELNATSFFTTATTTPASSFLLTTDDVTSSNFTLNNNFTNFTFTTTLETLSTVALLLNSTLLSTTAATVSSVATTMATTTSAIALPLAVMSLATAPRPASAVTMADDIEHLPKLMHTPSTSRLTIAKLALALNRINNIPFKWCTPETEERLNFNCHRAVRNVGDIRILQRVIMDVVSGNKDKVIFGGVGGSITAGHDVQHHQLYVNRMASVFSRALDVPTVTEIGALSATGSEFFAYCLHKVFDMKRLDIVAVEFCINDDRFQDFMPGYQPDKGRPMEELVRQLLHYDNIQPILVCFRQVRTLSSVGAKEPITDTECPSIEDTDFLPLAAYYALPLVSWKKVFCRSELRRNVSNFVAPDGVHPNANVHEQIGEFFGLLLKYAIEDLIGKLLSRYPSYIQPWNLPRPFTIDTAPGLYPSTWIHMRPMCYINFERKDTGWMTKSLSKAVTQSRNVNLQGTAGPLNTGDVLEYYEIHSNTSSVSFAFQLNHPDPQLYSLSMSLVYSTISHCTRDSVLKVYLSAKPSFSNSNRQKPQTPRFVNTTQINMPMRCYPGYQANMVDEIPWGSKYDLVNQLVVNHGNVILTLQKVEKYYPLYLQAIVAGWRKIRDEASSDY